MGRKENMVSINTNFVLTGKEEFDKLLHYIVGLQTVDKSNCDRCNNKKKYSRGILPIANLCRPCQNEVIKW